MLLAITCPVCGAPGAAPCGRCAAAMRPPPRLPAPPGLDSCVAVLAYEGAGRELVARLKYRNARASLPALARAIASLVDGAGIDVVTWVPTTPARRRQRGFDQARLLAGAVARRLGRPCRPFLLRRGPAQTGQPIARRRVGPRFEVTAVPRGRVLVVDDVITSGATMAAAASALRRAGAAEVHAAAAARTALKARDE